MISTANLQNNGKVKSQHPWERIIKYSHCNDYKIAHNSVNNPNYPTKKEKMPAEDRVRLTIIGNRVTKEFIHCVNLVKGLHRYRWKLFDVPIIRGVTTVEWPNVWKELKLQYGSMAYCLQNQVAIILNDKFLGGYQELTEILASRYNYHLTLDYYKEGVENFISFVRSSGRPCVYMHISIDTKYTGTLIFMLYADIVPYTCENFLRRCQSKKGGYSGTPVHRIVKDCWIQCGGFGLKSSELDCENFIVPHDKRGVLCMANDGRHVDCSTQFFVLLQPAPWMAHKYVAFGQLIDGDATLKEIEAVPTFYESPKSLILIQQAGILNLECQDIRINKTTNEYIQGHIEDLVVLGDLVIEELIEKVFLEIEMKRIALLKAEAGEGDGYGEGEGEKRNIRETERFHRKKSDIEQLQKNQVQTSRASSAFSEGQHINNEFDVEVYDYEPEEYSYQHVTVMQKSDESSHEKPERPYYLPLTDVPHPDDKDSTFDLKKLLRGDYCLESDLAVEPKKKKLAPNISFISEVYKFDDDSDSVGSLASDDEQEIRKYLKLNVDRVSFAGGIVRGIAKGIGKCNIFEDARKSDQMDMITDEELRKIRLASLDQRFRESKKVSISTPSCKKEPQKIKRRQTGFVRMEDIEKVYLINNSSTQILQEDDDSITGFRKVRIAESAIATQTGARPARRPTGFVKPPVLTESDTAVRRQSALTRLYENVTYNNEVGPTLKDFKSGKTNQKNYLLTYSPMGPSKSGESTKQNFRPSITLDNESFEQVLSMQHGKKAARKISSDYVKTIDQIEHKIENSIRSVEFAKTRPSMSVSEYQLKNMKRQEEIKVAAKAPSATKTESKNSMHGLRLPGDTPLYLSDTDERK